MVIIMIIMIIVIIMIIIMIIMIIMMRMGWLTAVLMRSCCEAMSVEITEIAGWCPTELTINSQQNLQLHLDSRVFEHFKRLNENLLVTWVCCVIFDN